MSAKGDLHTVLRHLVSNTQWGGNQGEKSEAMEALDRLTDDKADSDSDNDKQPGQTPEMTPEPRKATGATARR